MSSSIIRFEVIVPYIDNQSDPTRYAALQTFEANMQALFVAPQALFTYFLNNTASPNTYRTVFGYVTSAQSATALGYLNNLKAAIEPTYPVICVTWNGTLQP